MIACVRHLPSVGPVRRIEVPVDTEQDPTMCGQETATRPLLLGVHLLKRRLMTPDRQCSGRRLAEWTRNEKVASVENNGQERNKPFRRPYYRR